MKLCKDCKYERDGYCVNKLSERHDFVRGGTRDLCQIMRRHKEHCGPNAIWFEQKRTWWAFWK